MSTHTSKDALQFYLANQDSVDLSKLVQEFICESPTAFFELLGLKPGAVGAALAKGQPDLFMRLATQRSSRYLGAKKVVELASTDQRVPAIKKIREVYGLGLKEAKDVHDNLQHHLFTLGVIANDYSTAPALHGEQLAAFNFLKEQL